VPTTKICPLWTGFHVSDTQQEETWMMWFLWVSRCPLSVLPEKESQLAKQRDLRIYFSFSVWLWDGWVASHLMFPLCDGWVVPLTSCFLSVMGEWSLSPHVSSLWWVSGLSPHVPSLWWVVPLTSCAPLWWVGGPSQLMCPSVVGGWSLSPHVPLCGGWSLSVWWPHPSQITCLGS